MEKKVAIVQSNYIPWRGYFDLINSVDDFVLYDTVQYTKRDWRNRNKIKTPNGDVWLSIPVQVKGKYFQAIKDTKIVDQKWIKKHWGSIQLNYSKAAHFNEIKDWLEPLYLECTHEYISEINYRFLTAIKDYLGISTRLHWSSSFDLPEDKTEKLVTMCSALGATEYITGPSARGYLDEAVFHDKGMTVSWFHYAGYPDYDQLYPPFSAHLSILDLILNMGKKSGEYIVKQPHEQNN